MSNDTEQTGETVENTGYDLHEQKPTMVFMPENDAISWSEAVEISPMLRMQCRRKYLHGLLQRN
jgi:hypothetical protein